MEAVSIGCRGLQSLHLAHCVSPAERGGTALRQTDVIKLAFLDHLGEESDGIFDAQRAVQSRRLEEVNSLRPAKRLNGPLDGLFEALSPRKPNGRLE